MEQLAKQKWKETCTILQKMGEKDFIFPFNKWD